MRPLLPPGFNWQDWVAGYGALILILWFLYHKFQPIKNSETHDTIMQVLGVGIFFLTAAVAYVYTGWIGLGVLALVIMLR